MINLEEWRQIDYLLYLTKPFFDFTSVLTKTKDITIHGVFSVYNKLFDHLEHSIQQLSRKKVSLLYSCSFYLLLPLISLTLTSIRVREIRGNSEKKLRNSSLTYLLFLLGWVEETDAYSS
jgi:hypothetical protein